ncbi:TPA: hypothetical protein N0F65_010740 [Lagenidium giganteum]|uniref:SPX domain-containing protein n=1 Tax=Lagenidium giganteum TaxID=4803 RepID=A0AAV2YSP8_9STRA|nr:TPA: hypothetical protein N0F65_010740 [Lagenidium giganteum]
MKFGKNLLREILQSNPEWAPFWLNYKSLKKRIKAVTKVPAHQAQQAKDISESELEVAFFRDLQKELKKISLFYANEEKRCTARYHQLRSVLQDLKKMSTVDAFEAQRLMFAFVHFYRECIRLENFAVMNYQGFSKILKKHDKITGYLTRTKYMRRKVNLSSFSNYPQLLQILENTEEMFHDVEKDVRMSGHVSGMKLNAEDSTPTSSSSSPSGTPEMSPMAASRLPHPLNQLDPSATSPFQAAVATPASFPASVLCLDENEEPNNTSGLVTTGSQ